jgi:hypothetical protein
LVLLLWFIVFVFVVLLGTSRKKGNGTSDPKGNSAASKAARRLARKAEAARQSRRRKKAALGDMEETLARLESKHSELLKLQSTGKLNEHLLRTSHSSGSIAALAAANQRRHGDSSATNSRAGSPSLRSIVSSNTTPLGHINTSMLPPLLPVHAASQSDRSTPPSPSPIPLTNSIAANAANSTPTAPSSSYSSRFQSLLSQLTSIRKEEFNEKLSFLQQHTTCRTLSDLIIWLLARSHLYTQQLHASGQPVSSDSIGGPINEYIPATSLPPSLMESPQLPNTDSSSLATAWGDVLRSCGLTSHQLSILMSPHAGSSACMLHEHLESLRSILFTLRPKLISHTRDRDAHNHAIYSIFTPKQREILASTAFKQQQQSAAAASGLVASSTNSSNSQNAAVAAAHQQNHQLKQQLSAHQIQLQQQAIQIAQLRSQSPVHQSQRYSPAGSVGSAGSAVPPILPSSMLGLPARGVSPVNVRSLDNTNHGGGGSSSQPHSPRGSTNTSNGFNSLGNLPPPSLLFPSSNSQQAQLQAQYLHQQQMQIQMQMQFQQQQQQQYRSTSASSHMLHDLEHADDHGQ